MLKRLLVTLLPVILIAGLVHTFSHSGLGSSALEEHCLPCNLGISNSHAHQVYETVEVPQLLIEANQPAAETSSVATLPASKALRSRGPPLTFLS